VLTNAPVTAVVATTDIERARGFYGETLGLRPSPTPAPGPVVLYQCGGGTTLLVYERATAGDSEATSASFHVDDVDAEAARLRESGIVFEEYDFDDLKTENGVATMGDFKAAWFKDPDGNILCVSNEPGRQEAGNA
jgi:catechol 2,3-dioxygenase-like lactoylglutathione lyase family enzyme